MTGDNKANIISDTEAKQEAYVFGRRELDGFHGPGGRLKVEIESTEDPGIYSVHGAILTRRFIKISEAFPDVPRPPIDWC